jgi:riboflavin kinase / FMN adenylyltransferase
MKIYRNIFVRQNIRKKGIISIGYFDAMHLGHVKLISELVSTAKKGNFESFVLTYTHLPKKDTRKRLLEIDDKILFLSRLGVRNVIICDFNKKLFSLEPEKFISLLNRNFNISEFVIGRDFAFGYRRKGNSTTLQRSGHKYGIVQPLFLNFSKISTSLIKHFVSAGNIAKANKFLGYAFFVRGTVKKGKMLGRKLGFPTMNIDNENVIYPKDGVYITRTHVGNRTYDSMTYVSKPIIETNLLNYSKFHYNFKIKVDFFKKIRDNRSFADNESLVKQIKKDLEITKKYFEI